MPTKKPAGPDPETGLELVDNNVELHGSWQQRTIERRLSSARARALARSSRFLATALELVEESGKADFTIRPSSTGRISACERSTNTSRVKKN